MPLAGQVDFGNGYRLAATMGDVARGAVVSLVEAESGTTFATAFTDSAGRFSLSPNGFVPAPGALLFVEAARGLAAGGRPNRPGRALVRIRTLAAFENGTWRTLEAAPHSSGAMVSRGTTALCILADLGRLDAVRMKALLGSLSAQADPGTVALPERFAPGTSGLTQHAFDQAFRLVDNALTLDQDPLAAISGVPGALSRAEPRFVATRFDPPSGPPGTVVHVFGSHFPPVASLLSVHFGPATVPVETVATDGSQVSFVVPDIGPASRDVAITVKAGMQSQPARTFEYEPAQ